MFTTKIFNNLHLILIILGHVLNIGQSAFNAIASIVNRLTVSSKIDLYIVFFYCIIFLNNLYSNWNLKYTFPNSLRLIREMIGMVETNCLPLTLVIR